MDGPTRRHLETVLSVELTSISLKRKWLFTSLIGKNRLEREAAWEEIVQALADTVEQQFSKMERRRMLEETPCADASS